MEKIADNYGLNLDGIWNKELLLHQGRYPNDYHEIIVEAMQYANSIAQGDTNVFLKTFDKTIKNKVPQLSSQVQQRCSSD